MIFYSAKLSFMFIFVALLCGCSYAGEESSEDQDPFIAAKWGEFEVLKLHLKKNPALLNARDKVEATLLHYAAERNHPELVRYLVKQGAEVDALNSSKGLFA